MRGYSEFEKGGTFCAVPDKYAEWCRTIAEDTPDAIDKEEQVPMTGHEISEALAAL